MCITRLSTNVSPKIWLICGEKRKTDERNGQKFELFIIYRFELEVVHTNGEKSQMVKA